MDAIPEHARIIVLQKVGFSDTVHTIVHRAVQDTGLQYRFIGTTSIALTGARHKVTGPKLIRSTKNGEQTNKQTKQNETKIKA